MSTVKDVVRFLTFVHDGNISCIEPVIFESPNLHICIGTVILTRLSAICFILKEVS